MQAVDRAGERRTCDTELSLDVTEAKVIRQLLQGRIGLRHPSARSPMLAPGTITESEIQRKSQARASWLHLPSSLLVTSSSRKKGSDSGAPQEQAEVAPAQRTGTPKGNKCQRDSWSSPVYQTITGDKSTSQSSYVGDRGWNHVHRVSCIVPNETRAPGKEAGGIQRVQYT